MISLPHMLPAHNKPITNRKMTQLVANTSLDSVVFYTLEKHCSETQNDRAYFACPNISNFFSAASGSSKRFDSPKIRGCGAMPSSSGRAAIRHRSHQAGRKGSGRPFRRCYADTSVSRRETRCRFICAPCLRCTPSIVLVAWHHRVVVLHIGCSSPQHQTWRAM